MVKKNSNWYISSDVKFMCGILLVIPIIAIITAMFIPVIARLKIENTSNLSTNILVALISSGVTFLIFLIQKWRDSRREERERSNWQVMNLKSYYFDIYLEEEIKKSREILQDNRRKQLKATQTLNGPCDNISKALERIGIMIYIGAIPLSFALLLNGYQIATDWVLISPYVKEIRDSASENQQIPYLRRHAEWLCLICLMWVKTQRYVVNEDIAETLDSLEQMYGSYRRIMEKEELLFMSEQKMAGKGTSILRAEILRDYSFVCRHG